MDRLTHLMPPRSPSPRRRRYRPVAAPAPSRGKARGPGSDRRPRRQPRAQRGDLMSTTRYGDGWRTARSRLGPAAEAAAGKAAATIRFSRLRSWTRGGFRPLRTHWSLRPASDGRADGKHPSRSTAGTQTWARVDGLQALSVEVTKLTSWRPQRVIEFTAGGIARLPRRRFGAVFMADDIKWQLSLRSSARHPTMTRAYQKVEMA